MQTKVVKFGGSSLADAQHFKQVADIIKADPTRRFVVPSAPGKRHKNDTKVTDMLYHCYEMIRNHESIDAFFEEIKERYKLDQRILRNMILIYDRPENVGGKVDIKLD